MKTLEMIQQLRRYALTLEPGLKWKAFLNDMADRMETLHRAACPLEQLDDAYPVVLFFAYKDERDEFMAAVRREKPHLVPKQL